MTGGCQDLHFITPHQHNPVPFRIAVLDSDLADLHVVDVGDYRALDVGVGLLAEGAVEARLAVPAGWETSVCVMLAVFAMGNLTWGIWR